jgi:hypothetical protein
MEDQLLLFPEKIIYNNVESFDISNIPDNDFWRKNSKKFSDLPKNTYYIFKTGGINPYMKDKGPIFPYIQNVKSGKIIKVNSLTTDLYVRCNILGYGVRIHRIAAQAFITNPRNCIDVDHIDGNILNYCLSNLRWVSRSENMKKINRNDPKYEKRQENLKKKGNVFD